MAPKLDFLRAHLADLEFMFDEDAQRGVLTNKGDPFSISDVEALTFVPEEQKMMLVYKLTKEIFGEQYDSNKAEKCSHVISILEALFKGVYQLSTRCFIANINKKELKMLLILLKKQPMKKSDYAKALTSSGLASSNTNLRLAEINALIKQGLLKTEQKKITNGSGRTTIFVSVNYALFHELIGLPPEVLYVYEHVSETVDPDRGITIQISSKLEIPMLEESRNMEDTEREKRRFTNL